jgi:hypothetical protein
MRRIIFFGMMAALPPSCLPFLVGVHTPKMVTTDNLVHWADKHKWPSKHMGYLDSLSWYSTFYPLPRLPSVMVFNEEGLLMYRRSHSDCDKSFLTFIQSGNLYRRLPIDSMPWATRTQGWKSLDGTPIPIPNGRPCVVSLWTCYTPGLHHWVDSVENRLNNRREEKWQHWIISADWVGWRPD